MRILLILFWGICLSGYSRAATATAPIVDPVDGDKAPIAQPETDEKQVEEGRTTSDEAVVAAAETTAAADPIVDTVKSDDGSAAQPQTGDQPVTIDAEANGDSAAPVVTPASTAATAQAPAPGYLWTAASWAGTILAAPVTVPYAVLSYPFRRGSTTTAANAAPTDTATAVSANSVAVEVVGTNGQTEVVAVPVPGAVIEAIAAVDMDAESRTVAVPIEVVGSNGQSEVVAIPVPEAVIDAVADALTAAAETVDINQHKDVMTPTSEADMDVTLLTPPVETIESTAVGQEAMVSSQEPKTDVDTEIVKLDESVPYLPAAVAPPSLTNDVQISEGSPVKAKGQGQAFRRI